MDEHERKALFAAITANAKLEAQEKDCPQCGTANKRDTKFCPNCGASLTDIPTADVTRPEKRRKLFGKAMCPMCGIGTMELMDAGARGKAFGSGNLIGAFSKSHRCNHCGYLA